MDPAPSQHGPLPGASSTPLNGLTRSRRSHFSRKDSTPEMMAGSNQHHHLVSSSSGTSINTAIHAYTNPNATHSSTTNSGSGNASKLAAPPSAAVAGGAASADPAMAAVAIGAGAGAGDGAQQQQRIVYEYERLLYYARSPHSVAQPHDWTRICEQFPGLKRRVGQVNQQPHGPMGPPRPTGSSLGGVGGVGSGRMGMGNAYRRRDQFAGDGRSASLGASVEMCN